MRDGRLYETSVLRKIVFKNTSVLIFGRVANLLLTTLSSVLIVRYLGSEQLGQYASLYAYLALFSWLTSFGMEQILIRDTSKNSQKSPELFAAATLLSSLLSIIAASSAMLGAITLGYASSAKSLLFLACIDVLLLAPLRLSSAVFVARLKQWYWVGISVARQALWVVIILSIIHLRMGLTAVISGHLLSGLFEALAVFLLARRFVALRWRFDFSFAWNILKSSLPIALSGLAVSVYLRIDQVMLRILSGNQKLGYYVAAVKIAELCDIVGIALMNTMLPVLSSVAADRERFEHYVRTCFRYLMPFILGLCAITTIGSLPLMKALYGKEYLASSPVLSVLIWAEVWSFLSMVIGLSLIAKGLQKLALISSWSGAIANIILNAMFIPKWGPVGAAWATFISYSLAGFFALLPFSSARRLCVMGARESFIPVVLALSCVIILGPIGKPLALLLTPLVYGAGLLSLKVWSIQDVLNLFGMFVAKNENSQSTAA